MKEMLVPSLFIIGGILAGIISEKILLRKLHHLAAKTRWEGDDVLAASLKGIPVAICILAGLYGALIASPRVVTYISEYNRVFTVLAIILATVFLARISGGFAALYSQKIGGLFLSTSIFANLTKVLILTIGGLVVLQFLNISIAPILTALGVGGLAVALALQDTLSNLFAGIHILASKQMKPGDYVKLSSGEEGTIVDITWRYALIRTLPNHMIVVPNAKLASSVVTNFDLPEAELAVLVNVGIAYESDLDRVESVTIDVAKDVMANVNGGVPNFEPFIRYHTFGDFSIDFSVILRGRVFVDQYLIKHEFIKRLHARYRSEGIVIPFPCRSVYIQNTTPVPDADSRH